VHETNPIEQILNDPNEKIKQSTFTWLVEHLLPTQSDKFRGCEMIMPDTVFYKNGKPSMLVKCDEIYCLTATKNNLKGDPHSKKNQFSSEALFKNFSGVVRERKADKNGVFAQIYIKQMQIEAINKLKHHKTLARQGSRLSNASRRSNSRGATEGTEADARSTGE
jgi:hypothetical protein